MTQLKLTQVMLAVAEAVTVISLIGCGGGTGETAADGVSQEEAERIRWRRIDSVAPTVAITGPTAGGTTGVAGLTGTAAVRAQRPSVARRPRPTGRPRAFSFRPAPTPSP